MLIDDFTRAWQANHGSTPTHWQMTEEVWEQFRAECEANMTLVSDPKTIGKRELMGLPVILSRWVDGDWWLSNEPLNDDQMESRLREQLADLHRHYQRAAEPILREIAKIEASKPPKPQIIYTDHLGVEPSDRRNWGISQE